MEDVMHAQDQSKSLVAKAARKVGKTRRITFVDALNEAMHQEMERDSSVFVYGIEDKMFGSNNGLREKFGNDRAFATPLSEEAMAGFGLGAALNGMRPIHTHIRIDFMLLALNQIINMISSYHYGTAGQLKVPMVIRAVVGRGWGQGFQHSKSLQSMFAHIPGLKVIMPTTPYDAKGLMTAAIRDENPVISIEHRWLYWQEGDVPEKPYTIPIGESAKLREGDDLTIVATSWMNVEAIKAAEILARRGISIEIVDPRSMSPFNDEMVVRSVTKTGRCIVADNDWVHCGFSAEVAARVSEKCFGKLKSPVRRIGYAPTPCPTVRALENEFYPNAATIIRAVEKDLKLGAADLSNEDFYSHENRFKGPF
jgi:acetoin:2,6-dichlorophenolindophenol oxidoreductase subunit beta